MNMHFYILVGKVHMIHIPGYICNIKLFQLASRSLRRQTTPTVLFKLHTEDSGVRETTVLQTDPVNLVHMTKVLDEALQEIKSSYCRRILRNIK